MELRNFKDLKQNFGKIVLVIGLIFFLIAFIHTVAIAIQVQPTNPPFPIGISGTVSYNNNTLVDETITVVATNLETNEKRNFTTSDGRYAIALSGHDGDQIKVECYHEGEYARKSFFVDINKITQWCNLTLGETEDQVIDTKQFSYFFIPAFLFTIGGVVIDVYSNKYKK